MEIRHLRYFVAVAEELNFRRAAERLHVSAPALSVQIKMLEDLLDVRLFVRDTKSVALTIPGEVFLKEAKLLLKHMDEVISVTQEAAHGRQGKLKIGSPGQLGYSFMPASLEIYQKKYPFVDVRLMDLDIELQHFKALEKGDIQIGFAYGPSVVKLKNVVCSLMLDVPTRIVMSSSHSLAKLPCVSLADLSGELMLALGAGKSQLHAENMRNVFRARNLKIGSIKSISGYEAFIAMVGGGLGVSLLPEMKSISLVEGITVRPLKESASDLRLQLYAIWRQNETSPLVKNFIDILCRSESLRKPVD